LIVIEVLVLTLAARLVLEISPLSDIDVAHRLAWKRGQRSRRMRTIPTPTSLSMGSIPAGACHITLAFAYKKWLAVRSSQDGKS
jgi:hypothetical protein